MLQDPCTPGSSRIAELGLFIAPCPLVSRGKARVVSAAAVACNVGVGPARVFVRWSLAVGTGPETPDVVPAAYRVETSASSRDGQDGEWRVELVVDGNTARARGHAIEFDGQSWVRLVLTGADIEAPSEPHAPQPESLQLDVHDASNGTDDTWLVLGDELALQGLALVRGEPGFAERVHDAYPGYFPALFNEARAGESPAQTLARLGELLGVHAHVRHLALVYGSTPEPAALEELVVALLEAGRLPCVARWAAGTATAALEVRHGLVQGPDLRAWFDAHPEQLEAGRPNADGRRAMHRLWAEAMDVLYVPQ